MDHFPNLLVEVRLAKGQWLHNEGCVLLKVFLVHLLQEEEVLADLMGKVHVLVVNLQVVLIDYVLLPNSSAFGKPDHLLHSSK
jgi:hypothetical protein